ncbi:MAG: 5'(3')-deoxyribonucleotidase [Saprospiraceae bacterium]|nr:5'(3')-deoxyribonucleotidase [Saprospiraceae bacterium]
MKKRIAVDMDGVLADVEAEFIIWHERETGIRLTRENMNGKPDAVNFPNIRKWVYTEGFFRNLPLMADSPSIMKELCEKYDVFIVSAAVEFPQSMHEKHDWLMEHFPFIGWQKMVFCGLKTIIKADILIDDHFKNLDTFEGETLLFNASHNAHADAGRHRRVMNWREIADILL